MTAESADSGGRLFARLPFGVQFGLALVGLVFAVATLADIIAPPIPNDVWAIVWFAVAVGLLVRAVRLSRQS